MKATRTAFSIALAAMLSLALFAGCACTPSNESVIRDTVTKELDAYKNLDDAVLTKLATNADKQSLAELGISGEDFASAVVEGFEYHIDSIDVNDKTASVSVSIASKSATGFESLLDQAVNEFLEDPESDSMDASQKNAKIGQIAMDAFKRTEIVNESITLDFRLEDTTWVSTNASEVLGQLDSLVFSS